MLGERIRSTRERKGIRQADLARAVGIQPQSLWRLESGGTENPRIDLVDRIAEQLGCTIDFLVRGPKRGAAGGA